ncbi:hypothetical protein CR513_23032, partial [Mucuna pruriens]
MVGNTQQFGVRETVSSKVVNDVIIANNQRLENKITKLTSLVRQLAIGQHHTSPPAKVCGICASIEHPTHVCPTLQEPELNSAEVATMMGVLKPEIWFSPYANYTIEFLGGFGQVDGHNLKVLDTNWPIGHHCECKCHNLEEWHGATTIANSMNTIVVEVVAVQPPLPSIAQPLQPPAITANKLQAEQKERLLNDFKKLGYFYEHLVKHSTLSFLLKKPLEDVALELLKWMRLSQEVTWIASFLFFPLVLALHGAAFSITITIQGFKIISLAFHGNRHRKHNTKHKENLEDERGERIERKHVIQETSKIQVCKI